MEETGRIPVKGCLDLNLTIVCIVVNTHLSGCLRSVNVDLLLSLVVESFYSHYCIVGLPLAVALHLLILVFKRSTPHFYENKSILIKSQSRSETYWRLLFE